MKVFLLLLEDNLLLSQVLKSNLITDSFDFLLFCKQNSIILLDHPWLLKLTASDWSLLKAQGLFASNSWFYYLFQLIKCQALLYYYIILEYLLIIIQMFPYHFKLTHLLPILNLIINLIINYILLWIFKIISFDIIFIHL